MVALPIRPEASSMKAGFWHERWEANQLGFHQAEVNDLLKTWWTRLRVPPAGAVFVPLCGKSLDMTWLRSEGHPVVGVEVSPIAVRDFFIEAQIEAVEERNSSFQVSTGDGYTLYCGDFFDLDSSHLAGVQGVYDRASLIALPPEMRKRYAEHLCEILPQGVEILLVTIEYDPSKMSGPPHSVSRDEIDRYFDARFEIELMWSSGPQAPTPRFQERGLSTWCESVWRLSARARA